MDSFFSGMTYGMKKIKVPLICRLIIAILTFAFSYLSMYSTFGLKNYISPNMAKYIGASILIAMGLFVIINTIKDKIRHKEINCFEIMDYDNSNSISVIEAILLTVALSIDSFSMNFASALNGITTIKLPIFTAIFQFAFFSFGIHLGKNSYKILKGNIGKILINILPGLIFIIIGITRLI